MTATGFADLVAGAADVGALLVARGETIAVSESSTGGLIAASLVAVPGASAFMLGGSVVYTMQAGRGLLGDQVAAPASMRGATVEFARWQAESIAGRTGAVWGLGETGATGPSPNPYGDPVGHGWCAVVGPSCGDRHSLTGDGDRSANMFRFATAALECARDAIAAAG